MAGTAPNVTPVVVSRFVPVMSTRVPPAGSPVSGLNPVAVGGSTKLNAVLAVPPSVTTANATSPAAPAGETTVSSWSDTTVGVAADPPNCTEVAEARLRPEMVMVLPPATGPEPGDTERITGGGR